MATATRRPGATDETARRIRGSRFPGPASPPPAAQPQNLPALDRLLRLPACAALLDAHGHTLVANEARALLATLRAQALAGDLALGQIGADALAGALAERLQRRLQPAMRAVLNLTGTVIHTNLGRALLPQARWRISRP